MAIATVMMDTAAPAGSKFDPEVAAEIAEVAPGTLEPNQVKEYNLDDDAVSSRTIRAGAVTSEKIANGGVDTANYAAGSVDTAALGPASVTAEKAGTGVVTAYDAAGNPLASRDVYLTAAEYALIVAPDPNTTYYIS